MSGGKGKLSPLQVAQQRQAAEAAPFERAVMMGAIPAIPPEGVVLGRAVGIPERPEPNIAELVARFQLETESALRALRDELLRAITEQARLVASMRDEWDQTRGEVSGLRTTVEDAMHRMQTGITEAITAARSANASAKQAETSALVFDKLKASQPDFHRMVQDQNRTVAGVREALAHLEERLSVFSKRLDEFDAVAVDYADTKGEVRGLDLVVKDLNNEARQRRQVGVRG